MEWELNGKETLVKYSWFDLLFGSHRPTVNLLAADRIVKDLIFERNILVV